MEFTELYRLYHDSVARYMARMVGPAEAPDATQEVFAKIDRGLANFAGQAQITTWIYRIATNTAIDWLRKRQKRQPEIPLFHAAECAVAEGVGEAMNLHTAGPTEAMIVAEMNDCIREQVNKLPEKYRTVMILSSLEELELQDIAAILGITKDAAKVRLHRARAMLKKILEDECRFYANPASGALACDRKLQGKGSS